MDAKTETEERAIALKLMIEEEEITVVALYDTNTNTDCLLVEIENILEDMEAHNGLNVGGDFNTITNKDWDQKKYKGEHTRTKETMRMGNQKEIERCIQNKKVPSDLLKNRRGGSYGAPQN